MLARSIQRRVVSCTSSSSASWLRFSSSTNCSTAAGHLAAFPGSELRLRSSSLLSCCWYSVLCTKLMLQLCCMPTYVVWYTTASLFPHNNRAGSSHGRPKKLRSTYTVMIALASIATSVSTPALKRESPSNTNAGHVVRWVE